MAFNRDNVISVKQQFAQKHELAVARAEQRTRELAERFPEIREIDQKLRKTASELFLLAAYPDREARFEKIRRDNLELMEKRRNFLLSRSLDPDYDSVHYECEKCEDTGYVGYQMCDCMRRALIAAGYASSGMGELLKEQNFSNFSLDYYKEDKENLARMRSNLETARAFAQNFSKAGGHLLMLGPTGLGKTHLSTAIAAEVLNQGYDVLYVSAVGLVADFQKERFGGTVSAAENESTSRYYEADLLIIDDLGTEVVNQFTLSVLYNLLNERMMRKQSMIINSNLNHRELKERYSDRIYSRLLGNCQILLFSGKDIRMQKIRGV